MVVSYSIMYKVGDYTDILCGCSYEITIFADFVNLSILTNDIVLSKHVTVHVAK